LLRNKLKKPAIAGFFNLFLSKSQYEKMAMECQPRKHGYPLKMAQKKRILDAYPHFLLKVHKDLTTLHLSRFYIFNKNYGRTFYYKF